MSLNTPLAVVRSMLKAETGKSLDVTATSQDAEQNQIIHNTQLWLASDYDWPFLMHRWLMNVVASQRYVTFPTQNEEGDTVNFDCHRPFKLEVAWTSNWQKVQYGIGSQEFNYLDPNDNEIQDPVQRFSYDGDRFEIWPLPASAQQLMLTGQRVLTSLQSNPSTVIVSGAGTSNANGTYTWSPTLGYVNTNSYKLKWNSTYWSIDSTATAYLYTCLSLTGTWAIGTGPGTSPAPTMYVGLPTWDDTATLDLDDLLIIFFSAAHYLTRENPKNPAAQFLLEKAKNRMAYIRASYPQREMTTIIGGAEQSPRIRTVPMVVVASSNP